MTFFWMCYIEHEVFRPCRHLVYLPFDGLRRFWAESERKERGREREGESGWPAMIDALRPWRPIPPSSVSPGRQAPSLPAISTHHGFRDDGCEEMIFSPLRRTISHFVIAGSPGIVPVNNYVMPFSHHVIRHGI